MKSLLTAISKFEEDELTRRRSQKRDDQLFALYRRAIDIPWRLGPDDLSLTLPSHDWTKIIHHDENDYEEVDPNDFDLPEGHVPKLSGSE